MVRDLSLLLHEQHHMATILTFLRMCTYVSALAKNHAGINKESINLCCKLIDAMVHDIPFLLREHHMVTILTFLRTCTFVSALAKTHTGCLLQMKY